MPGILSPADAVAGAPSYTGRLLRQAGSVLHAGGSAARRFGARSGVRPSIGTPVSMAGLTWTMQPHPGVLDLEASNLAGVQPYTFDVAQTGTIDAQPASPSSRIDILSIRHDDPAEGDGSGTPKAVVVYTAGAAATTPQQPATPARSMLVAVINVPSSGGGSPAITWVAPAVVATGGILPVTGTSDYPANPYRGQYLDDPTLGLLRWDGGGWRPGTVGKFFTNITLDASGFATVNHGLGRTPIAVIVTPSSPISGSASAGIFASAMTDSYTALAFRVRGLGGTGAAMVGNVNFSAVFA